MEQTMKALNSPLLFLALLAGFFALAFCAHDNATKLRAEQAGSSQRELDQATEFVAFQLKHYPVAVYHPKTQREAALIAADVWNIEVRP
jgi:hypothetical protein